MAATNDSQGFQRGRYGRLTTHDSKPPFVRPRSQDSWRCTKVGGSQRVNPGPPGGDGDQLRPRSLRASRQDIGSVPAGDGDVAPDRLRAPNGAARSSIARNWVPARSTAARHRLTAVGDPGTWWPPASARCAFAGATSRSLRASTACLSRSARKAGTAGSEQRRGNAPPLPGERWFAEPQHRCLQRGVFWLARRTHDHVRRLGQALDRRRPGRQPRRGGPVRRPIGHRAGLRRRPQRSGCRRGPQPGQARRRAYRPVRAAHARLIVVWRADTTTTRPTSTTGASVSPGTPPSPSSPSKTCSSSSVGP